MHMCAQPHTHAHARAHTHTHTHTHTYTHTHNTHTWCLGITLKVLTIELAAANGMISAVITCMYISICYYVTINWSSLQIWLWFIITIEKARLTLK